MQDLGNRTPRFKIGTTYETKGKGWKRLHTVTDILKTFNAAGQLVRIRYIATHPGPIGGLVTDYDVCETTIARGRLP